MSALTSPDSVRNLLESNPEWCKTPSGDNNELPLFQSILNKASYEVTELLLSVHPEAISHSDDDGNTALHCACAVGDVLVVGLLLEKGAAPELLNHDGETPMDILSTVQHVHEKDLKEINKALRHMIERNVEKNKRSVRRRKREELWGMTEKAAWFYAAIHNSVPIHYPPESLERSGINLQGLCVSSIQVITELVNEDDFDVNVLCTTTTTSSDDSKRPRTALQLACMHLNVPVVQHLLLQLQSSIEDSYFSSTLLRTTSSAAAAAIQAAVTIVEGIITAIIVDNELSTLAMHQAGNIRAPSQSSGRQKNKNMESNGQMKRIKHGESKDESDIGKMKELEIDPSEKFSIGDATIILRMLTKGKHPLFEEDRLRRLQWLRHMPGEDELSETNGVDILLRDPLEYSKMLKNIERRAQRKKTKNIKKVKNLVQKRKRRAKELKELEMKRREHNATLLVSGKSFNVKTNKFWFASGWKSESLEVMDNIDSENLLQHDYDVFSDDDGDEYDGGRGSGRKCCVM